MLMIVYAIQKVGVFCVGLIIKIRRTHWCNVESEAKAAVVRPTANRSTFQRG